MMEGLTNSSNNTVYADADGTIAYYHGNFIPRRDTSFNYAQPVDGSNPATDWTGLHPVSEAITVVNPPNGWIQNCNSTPFTAAGVYSPKVEDYPYYMSINRENFRGVHAQQLLEGSSGHTLESLIQLAHDPYLPAFAVLIPGLVEAANAPADLAEALDTLRNWDFRTSAESVAMTLAHFYALEYNRSGTAPDGLTAMQRLEYFGTDSPDAEKLSAFATTIRQLEEDFGTWKVSWGEVNRLQRLDGAIRSRFDDMAPSLPVGFASGRWGALAAYGARSVENTKKLYGVRGNSFVAVVEFGDSLRAKSMLVGGQSGDPESPHFFDQAQRYIDINWKDVAYYREAVEARAQATYRPGE